jgi:cystathionine beta-synthase
MADSSPAGPSWRARRATPGIALALIARQKGYRVVVVMPDKMSQAKISHLRALGAEVTLTRSDVEKGHPEYYQDVAARIASERPDAFFINQFGNEANPDAHALTTGPEIWEQMNGDVDAVVVGVGSGGTLSGVGRSLRERNPDIEVILADPDGSILAPLVNEGKHVQPGSWLVEGIGEDFVPSICDLDLVTKAYTVTDKEAYLAVRHLLQVEGVLAGTSVGVLLTAALRYCREQTQPKRVVTFICDSGSKYIDKVFNDFWMIDQGLLDRETHGDLRDLIARQHDRLEDVTIRPSTPLLQAFKTMRLYEVSQMVVLDEERVAGIIDESDLLMAVTHDASSFHRPVSDFMTSRLETLPPTASVHELMPIFRADRVAIIADGDSFYGLITKIDLVNYLRQQLS